ncbi:MAG: hypothetical protein MUF84_11620 [Anaerolineae bacterium]|jgi:hypothetical protein|nr:hypothetical protein [Anaerolineae bacterium]
MAITYFGRNLEDAGSSSVTVAGYAWRNNPAQVDYVCPGSGNQKLVELSVRGRLNNAGDTGLIRLAIYNTSLGLLYEGSAAVSLTQTSAYWAGHTAFLDVDGNPVATPLLTGGTSYIIAVSAILTSGAIYIYRGSGSSGDYKFYNTTDYTVGFPNEIAAGSDSTSLVDMRAGVEPYVPPDYDFTERHHVRLVF